MPYKSKAGCAIAASRSCTWCGNALILKTQRDLIRKKYCSASCRQKARYAAGDMPWVSKLRKPKGTKDTFTGNIVCDLCGSVVARLHSNQRWCLTCVPDKRARSIASRYGLSKQAHDALLSSQNNKCAICEKHLTRPCIDHCHNTGKIRGILCDICNYRLSVVEDVEFVSKAKTYLATVDTRTTNAI